jgi:sigma-B regulation protein RsbU (phosphoserine phosphatase)
MSAFFKRRTSRPAALPVQPVVEASNDSTQTMYVTGDARRDTDRIRMLVESLREVSSDLDPDELMVTMVDRAVKLVGAERGLLFTMDGDGRPVLNVARSSGGRDLPRNAAFSTKVVETALVSGKSVCEKIDEAGAFDPSRSMIDLNIRAVMCVPLTARDQTLGALCVDTRASQRTFSRSELRYFEAFADMLAVVWSNRRIQEERLLAARMSQDLQLARRIQTNLLPERPLVREGYAMCGKVQAAEETGGDYFDFFVTRDDKLVMAVGDVSGHGVAAALIMAGARAYLRGFAESSSSPGTILRRVNRALGQDTADDMFMSMFICVLDPHTRDFHYANAGHTRPVLLHASSSETEDYRVTGVALGVEGDSDYEERGPFKLGPGDTIVMFSDGLTELRNGDEQYGRARVIESIKRHSSGTAPELLEGVFDDAVGWSSGEERHADDVTVAVLRADR